MDVYVTFHFGDILSFFELGRVERLENDKN